MYDEYSVYANPSLKYYHYRNNKVVHSHNILSFQFPDMFTNYKGITIGNDKRRVNNPWLNIRKN